ncbi:MAG: O-antigen ligase family protein [Acidimicrobiia bacterium]
MLAAPPDIGVFPARQAAVAVFGSIAAVVAGILASVLVSSEVGGVVGFVGVGVAVFVALRPLPVGHYLKELDPLPAAAILLFLLGALVPASLGIAVLPGISIDDLPTLAAAGLTVWWLIENRSRTMIPRVAAPLIVMIVWLMFAWALGNPSFKALLIGPGRWSMYAVLVIAGATWFKDHKLRSWAIGVVIAIATSQALIAIWSYHSNWSIQDYFIGMEPFVWYHMLYDEVPGRATGLLGISSNFFGAYTLVPAFASLGVASYTRHARLKTAMVATFGILTYAGVLSYTRATLIALVLGLIGFLVVTRPYRLTPVIIAITVIAVLSTPILSRFEQGNDRVALASQAGSTILENAVIGIGSGRYVEGDEEAPTVTPHNSFLLQASETGILGGLLLLVSVLALMGGVWGGALPRRAGSGAMATAIFAGLGALLVQTMSNNLLHIPPVATQFWLVGIAGVGFAAAAEGRWARFLMDPVLGRETL